MVSDNCFKISEETRLAALSAVHADTRKTIPEIKPTKGRASSVQLETLLMGIGRYDPNKLVKADMAGRSPDQQ